MSKSELFWDKISNKYDNQVKKYEQTYYKTIDKTKKYLDKNDLVLDYGCGTGIITTEISNSVKTIHACDISSKMINVAEGKKREKKIKNIEFFQTDIFDEQFEKESYDVILAFNILYFIKDIQAAIRRINELLKLEGLFISATDCLGEKKAISSFVQYTLGKTGIIPSLSMLKMHELETLISSGNFQILETENLYDTPPNYYIVSRKSVRI